MTSLTKQQQRTLIYIAGFVLSLGLAGWLLYDLNGRQTAAARLEREVTQKERDSRNLAEPGAEELAEWAQQQAQLTNILLLDQAEPEFLAEVTRIATENRLQRVGVTSENKIIDPEKGSSAEELKALGVGIRRYVAVTIKFTGDYADIARFLGSVSNLERAVEYHTINLKRNAPFIEVEVVMNVYKREPA